MGLLLSLFKAFDNKRNKQIEITISEATFKRLEVFVQDVENLSEYQFNLSDMCDILLEEFVEYAIKEEAYYVYSTLSTMIHNQEQGFATRLKSLVYKQFLNSKVTVPISLDYKSVERLSWVLVDISELEDTEELTINEQTIVELLLNNAAHEIIKKGKGNALMKRFVEIHNK